MVRGWIGKGSSIPWRCIAAARSEETPSASKLVGLVTGNCSLCSTDGVGTPRRKGGGVVLGDETRTVRRNRGCPDGHRRCPSNTHSTASIAFAFATSLLDPFPVSD